MPNATNTLTPETVNTRLSNPKLRQRVATRLDFPTPLLAKLRYDEFKTNQLVPSLNLSLSLQNPIYTERACSHGCLALSGPGLWDCFVAELTRFRTADIDLNRSMNDSGVLYFSDELVALWQNFLQQCTRCICCVYSTAISPLLTGLFEVGNPKLLAKTKVADRARKHSVFSLLGRASLASKARIRRNN